MAELTVDVVYGASLFDVSVEIGRTKEIAEDFNVVIKSLEQNPMFLEFLSTPTIPKDEKKEVVKNCFDGKISNELLISSIEIEAGTLLGKHVNLKNEIDKTIIGGFKILIEGKVIDASVKKRLMDLKDSLMHMDVKIN